jgi:hypothetical protein
MPEEKGGSGGGGWRRLDLPDWGYVGFAFAVVTIGVGLFFMSAYQIAGSALIFLGLALALFSLRPAFKSLPWVRAWKRRRAARAQAAAQAAARQHWTPILAAWDAFYPAASEVVRLFYDLRDIGRPLSAEEWTGFTEATQRAVSLAASLREQTRTRALDLLQPFAEVSKDGLELCSVPAADLKNWLTERFRDHLHARDKIGPPGGA